MYSVRDTFRWVSPFGHLRIKAYLPAPRSFSQAITSFIAYHCQGIHHMLLFTWPYNFDVSNHTLQRSSKLGVVFKECLFGLSPNALCRINLRLISDDSNPQIQAKRFLSKLKVVLTQSKKLLLTTAWGTVCTKPLRMCSFLKQPSIKAFINNADKTLWIFKEQPIIEMNQSSLNTFKEDA